MLAEARLWGLARQGTLEGAGGHGSRKETLLCEGWWQADSAHPFRSGDEFFGLALSILKKKKSGPRKVRIK